jgi:GTPase Era involved in 16S rRNA processing
MQVILLDTPGVIARKRNHLEARMMSFVKASMKQADALVAIVDIRHEPGELLAMLQPPKSAERPPMLVALNKADLCSAQEVAAAEVCSCKHSS